MNAAIYCVFIFVCIFVYEYFLSNVADSDEKSGAGMQPYIESAQDKSPTLHISRLLLRPRAKN